MTWTRKIAVFEKSYDEVLTALKHQDDKLNRTLTAIAFLTAAGVAIYANLATRLEGPVRFEESKLDATVVFFIIFLISVLLALLVALSAIGPSRAMPSLRSRPSKEEEWPSLLFWARIVKDDAWAKRLDKEPDWLEECLARNVHAEAKTIARRVDYKVARSRESGAFVQVGVLSLALLGIFSIETIRLEARWWIASVVLLGVLALPLWDLAQMRHYDFHEGSARGSYALVATIILFAGLLLLGAQHFDIHWWAAFYAIGAILATRLGYVNRRMTWVFLLVAALSGPAVLLVALVL